MISVIMSAYNEEKYISEAIESILNQTYRDLEFIIINDGSKDNTKSIIDKYAGIDNRIRLIHHDKSIGLAVSLNEGIRAASGEYIARQDADDKSIPERLGKQQKYLQENSDTTVIGSYYLDIDEKGQKIPRRQNPVEWEDIKKAMFFYNPIAHPTVMFRKKIFDDIGLYNESFRTSQDYELFARIFLKYKIYNLPEYLVIRRFPEEVFRTNKMRRQDIDSMRVRWNLLKKGAVPWYYFFYYLKVLCAFFLPIRFREQIRRKRHNKF